MKPLTKVRKQNGKVITSVLVCAGVTVMGCAHVPAEPIRQKGIENHYIDSRGYNVQKSEERKKAILADIRRIRKQLRAIPMSTKHMEEGDMGYTVQPPAHVAKEAIRQLALTGRFIDRIWEAKTHKA